jgi:hypothetical protein
MATARMDASDADAGGDAAVPARAATTTARVRTTMQ